MLTSGQTDIAEANALSHDDEILDIYSNSWGPSDAGYIVNGPGPMASMTLEQGVLQVYSLLL